MASVNRMLFFWQPTIAHLVSSYYNNCICIVICIGKIKSLLILKSLLCLVGLYVTIVLMLLFVGSACR